MRTKLYIEIPRKASDSANRTFLKGNEYEGFFHFSDSPGR